MQSTTSPKGIAIHRSERVCIDISDNIVSVIKLDPQGVMIKAGSAKAPVLPTVPDDAYVTDLSEAIKKAAWAAKVSVGFGGFGGFSGLSASCVVVTSMPDMTIQRFRWPDMPTDALINIAREEMAPFLPRSKSNYHIGCEILGREVDDSGQPMLEVLVAAMPEEHAVAVDTACRWANFKPKRIDIRENARGRLVQHWCAPIEGVLPSTYAILDAGPGHANIAFYHKGVFHSNRYFAPELVKLEEVQDFESLMSVKAGGIDNNENAMHYDTGKLSEEITSAINHFHRLTHDDKISCVLLMDDENIPGIEERLRADVDVLVLKPSQWVKPGIKRPNLRRIEQDSFLDAFAVGMPSFVDHDCHMDLRNSNSASLGSEYTAGAGTAPPEVKPALTESPISESEVSSAVLQPDIPSANTDAVPPPVVIKTDQKVPIKAGYVELPKLPPEIADLETDHSPLHHDPAPDLSPATPKHHESPFDIVSAKTEEHSGFPYAVPEDPDPVDTKKSIITAVAIVVLVLLVAILIPIRTTFSLRSELNGLNEEISNHVSNDELFMLDQERGHVDRQINAIRRDISRVNERMDTVRSFYARLPAMIAIQDILESSGLVVDSINAIESPFEHRIIVSGRTNNFQGMFDGLTYLRDNSRHHYLFTSVSFAVAETPDSTNVDAYGFASYTITITAGHRAVPFWLNSHIERRWQ